MTTLFLRKVLFGMLAFLWTTTLAFAAGVTLDQTLSGLTWLVAGLVMLLSTLSGASALLWRVDKELRAKAPGTPLERPWLFVSANMVGSWLAGWLAFIMGEAGDINDWAELGGIVMAAFIGARFVEMMAEKYAPKMPEPKA